MGCLKKATAAVMATLCLALFSIAVIGNLFVGSVQEQTMAVASEPATGETAVWEATYTEVQMQQNTAEAVPVISERGKEEDRQKQLQNKLASLRMMRDKSWQKLLGQVEEIPETEKIQWIEKQAMLQYKEQRLELLLAAKGFEYCLVVLEEEQANIIAEETSLSNRYEQLYDMVLRNSGYPAEQIVLIPLV